MRGEYFIRDREGGKSTLGELVVRALRVSPAAAAALIAQGGVWDWARRQRQRDGSRPAGETLFKVFVPPFPVRPCRISPASIRYQDDLLLAVIKEAGVPVQPTPYSDLDCLAAGVNVYLRDTDQGGPAHLINRLDRPAMGLVLFARDRAGARSLSSLFHGRQMEKTYLVLTAPFPGVQGEYSLDAEIEWRGQSRGARTRVRFLGERRGRFAFLAWPETGRTHQIREHFRQFLTPIDGDIGPASTRIMLACVAYRFDHPRGHQPVVISYLPDCFLPHLPSGFDPERG
ncbi:MAG TPA: pseudouridine synthase [Candidatus Aminicenantes bacterium]|nr:pseudouridine synthase [Candidatus Aminicenantes bacterium]